MLHVKYQWLTFLSFFIWKLGSLKSLCLCYKYWNFHRIVVFTLTYVCMHTHQCIHTEAMFWLYLHCWCGSWGCIHWTKCCRKKLLILTIAEEKLSLKHKQATSCTCEVRQWVELGHTAWAVPFILSKTKKDKQALVGQDNHWETSVFLVLQIFICNSKNKLP